MKTRFAAISIQSQIRRLVYFSIRLPVKRRAISQREKLQLSQNKILICRFYEKPRVELKESHRLNLINFPELKPNKVTNAGFVRFNSIYLIYVDVWIFLKCYICKMY